MNKKVLVILYGLERQQLLAIPILAKLKRMSPQAEIHLVTESENKKFSSLIKEVSYFHFVEEGNLNTKHLEHWQYHSVFNLSPHTFARTITKHINAEHTYGYIQLQNGEPSWTSSWFKHIEEYQENEGRDLFHLLDLWRLGLKMDRVNLTATREIDHRHQILGFCPLIQGDAKKAVNVFKIIQNLHAVNVDLNFHWLTNSDEDYRLICEMTSYQGLPLKVIQANTLVECVDHFEEMSLLVTDNAEALRVADFYSDVPMLSLHPNLEHGKKYAPYRKGNWILSPLKDSSGTQQWNEKLLSELVTKLLKKDEVDILRWAQEHSHLLLLSQSSFFLEGNLWSIIPVDQHFRTSYFRSLIENVVWLLTLNGEKNIGSVAFTLAHEIGLRDRFLGHLGFWENETCWLEGRLNSYSWLEKQDHEWNSLVKRVDNSEAWQKLSHKRSDEKTLQEMRRQREFKELNIKRIQIKGRLIQQIQSFVKEPSA